MAEDNITNTEKTPEVIKLNAAEQSVELKPKPLLSDFFNKLKPEKSTAPNNGENLRPVFYKNVTNRLGLSKIGQILIVILLLSMISELLFFGSIKRDSSIQIQDFESKITGANSAIESARGVKRNSSDLTGKERLDIENSAKVDLTESIGAKIDTVIVDEKIPRPGSQSVYYKVKFQYSVKDLDSLKTLAAIVYLNPYVLKITNIDNSYIYVVMTNAKIEETEE